MVSTKLLPPVDITMATTTTNNSSGRTTTLQKWKQQLVTQDDAFHHHKILGSLVLGILIWRFMGILVGSPPQSSATRNSSNSCDLRFLSHPEWTWPTLAIHFALNLSSFQFQIPQRRIQDGGRIWPEYRMHAFCFAFRSMVLIALYDLELRYGLEPNFNWNYYILMGNMIIVDLVSWSMGKYRSRSVRDLDVHPVFRLFFSFVQFNTSAGILYGIRRFTLPFLIIFVTQTTPFLATLRRKHLFQSNGLGAAVYGTMLVLSAILVQLDYRADNPKTAYIVRTIAQLAALQRMTPLDQWVLDKSKKDTVQKTLLQFFQSKYIVWTGMFLLTRYIRSNLEDITIDFFRRAWVLTLVLCVVVGYYKIRSQQQEYNLVKEGKPNIKET